MKPGEIWYDEDDITYKAKPNVEETFELFSEGDECFKSYIKMKNQVMSTFLGTCAEGESISLAEKLVKASGLRVYDKDGTRLANSWNRIPSPMSLPGVKKNKDVPELKRAEHED
jgi:hypothetical protein